MERRLLVPGLVLAVGIVVLFIGLARAQSDSVTCGGRSMSPGDTCIHLGQGRSTSFDQELALKRRNGWIYATVGGLMSGGSGYALYWRTAGSRRRDERIARDRSAFAAAHGWTYQRENPRLLRSWRTRESLLVTDSAGWNVLSGSANGRQFQVFDGEVAGRLRTMCAVPLATEVPELQVTTVGDPKLLRTGRQVNGYPNTVWGEPEAARAMLTPAVMEVVKAHRRGFALSGQALVVIRTRRGSSEGIVPIVDAATKLAALLPATPGR